jgi:hypothetical protein
MAPSEPRDEAVLISANYTKPWGKVGLSTLLLSTSSSRLKRSIPVGALCREPASRQKEPASQTKPTTISEKR